MVAQIAFGLRVQIPARSTASLGGLSRRHPRCLRAGERDVAMGKEMKSETGSLGTSAKLKPSISAGI
jgi:hypothetical protein